MRATILALVVALAAPTAATALTTFSSPSRNIGCYMDRSAVRCDIRLRTWSPPRKPAACDVDYGQGIGLGRRASFVCAGDTALGAKRRLAYGSAIRVGHFTCTSRARGMTCRNHLTSHGFTLARDHYRIF